MIMKKKDEESGKWIKRRGKSLRGRKKKRGRRIKRRTIKKREKEKKERKQKEEREEEVLRLLDLLGKYATIKIRMSMRFRKKNNEKGSEKKKKKRNETGKNICARIIWLTRERQKRGSQALRDKTTWYQDHQSYTFPQPREWVSQRANEWAQRSA